MLSLVSYGSSGSESEGEGEGGGGDVGAAKESAKHPSEGKGGGAGGKGKRALEAPAKQAQASAKRAKAAKRGPGPVALDLPDADDVLGGIDFAAIEHSSDEEEDGRKDGMGTRYNQVALPDALKLSEAEKDYQKPWSQPSASRLAANPKPLARNQSQSQPQSQPRPIRPQAKAKASIPSSSFVPRQLRHGPNVSTEENIGHLSKKK